MAEQDRKHYNKNKIKFKQNAYSGRGI